MASGFYKANVLPLNGKTKAECAVTAAASKPDLSFVRERTRGVSLVFGSTSAEAVPLCAHGSITWSKSGVAQWVTFAQKQESNSEFLKRRLVCCPTVMTLAHHFEKR